MVTRSRLGSNYDRLLAARLDGIALRHARWGGLTEAGKADGAAQLPQAAGGCGELLAGVAGLALGPAEIRGPEYQARSRGDASRHHGVQAAGPREAAAHRGAVTSPVRVPPPSVPPFFHNGTNGEIEMMEERK
jgi:hypothetical protein